MEITDDAIESDAAEAHRRLLLTTRFRDDHDRSLRAENRACPRGVLAAEPDVYAAGEMCGRELGGVAGIEDLRTRALKVEKLLQRHRLQPPGERLVERRTLFRVQHRVVHEVRRRVWLIRCDELNEGLAGHR